MPELKYETEIDSLLKDLFYEDWMNAEDWEEFLVELFKETKISKQLLSDQVQIGINNGYSLMQQLEIIRQIFTVK